MIRLQDGAELEEAEFKKFLELNANVPDEDNCNRAYDYTMEG